MDMKSKNIIEGSKLPEFSHSLSAIEDAATLCKLLAKEDAAFSIRYRIARVKKNFRAFRNALNQKCLSVFGRGNSHTLISASWDAGDIPNIRHPRAFQGDESWMPLKDERPKLRVILGGKSNKMQFHTDTVPTKQSKENENE